MPQQTTPIRILLVDDSEHVLWGLGKLIDAERPTMMVVGRARTVTEAFGALRECRPDVVLLDIFLAGDNSLDYLPDMLSSTAAKVLVLTGAADVDLHRRAVQLGARAVVRKEQPAQVLLDTIAQIHGEPARGGAIRAG
jgi:two-component system, NarL family, nitrate/nitrite response regulator NarL